MVIPIILTLIEKLCSPSLQKKKKKTSSQVNVPKTFMFKRLQTYCVSLVKCAINILFLYSVTVSETLVKINLITIEFTCCQVEIYTFEKW